MSVSVDPDKINQLSTTLDLKGKELLEFIKSENDKTRNDRARDRSLERIKLEQREAERQHELAVCAAKSLTPNDDPYINRLKLLPFTHADDLSSYLTRFERITSLYK